jgi:hypothetical protein
MIQAFTASAVVNPDLAALASAALNPSILFLYASSTAFFVLGCFNWGQGGGGRAALATHGRDGGDCDCGNGRESHRYMN